MAKVQQPAREAPWLMKLSLSNIGVNAGVAALYFLLGKLGFLAPLAGRHAALFWLPAGPALAAILLLGARVSGGVFIGAFLVALPPHVTVAASFWRHLAAAGGIASGQVLQAMAGAWLVERWARGRLAFKEPHTIFRFAALAAGLSTTIGPTLGLASSLLAKVAHPGGVRVTWLTWWLGGAMSTIVLTPLIITWSERPARRLRPKKLGELGMLLFESTPHPMWVYDYSSLRFRAVNNAAVAHYGYSVEEFLGMRVTDLGPEQDRSRQLDEIAKARAGLPAVRQWQHRKKDGTIIDVEIASHNLNLEGRPCAIVVSTDISQRLRDEREILRLNAELEERVRARTEQLEATNKELESFAYSVSHDLRAPLRSIRGFSEVLLERYGRGLQAEGRDFLRRAYDSCAQMDKLIEDLLKLSRAGRSELVKADVDLSALADGIASELRETDPQREVEVVITPGLSACGDEHLLRIALNNLLRNAWKFTRDQPRPRIEFGSTSDQPPAFFVRDNGAGFDMTYAERLFGVFQRLHTASEFPGTGVGLATVKRIINRHGGRAWATGAVRQGATFFFTLPANGHY